jgi:hypothetical protein
MKALITVFALLSFAAASAAVCPAQAMSRSESGGMAVAKAANDNAVVKVEQKKKSKGKKGGKKGKKGGDSPQ